jgi:hypothetical protein
VWAVAKTTEYHCRSKPYTRGPATSATSIVSDHIDAVDCDRARRACGSRKLLACTRSSIPEGITAEQFDPLGRVFRLVLLKASLHLVSVSFENKPRDIALFYLFERKQDLTIRLHRSRRKP